jgi:hypothetical protein
MVHVIDGTFLVPKEGYLLGQTPKLCYQFQCTAHSTIRPTPTATKMIVTRVPIALILASTYYLIIRSLITPHHVQ